MTPDTVSLRIQWKETVETYPVYVPPNNGETIQRGLVNRPIAKPGKSHNITVNKSLTLRKV
jgi:hypothetical protein